MNNAKTMLFAEHSTTMKTIRKVKTKITDGKMIKKKLTISGVKEENCFAHPATPVAIKCTK